MSESRALPIEIDHAITPARLGSRDRAVCPECQHHQVVRVSGVMAKHRAFTGAWCTGAGLTPVPIPVRKPDLTPAGLHDAKTLARWDFLSQPLLVLLHKTRTEVREVAEPGFVGSIHPVVVSSPWRWVVRMPIGGDVLDHDLTVRGLLAAANGIDISDWPNGVAVRAG